MSKPSLDEIVAEIEDALNEAGEDTSLSEIVSEIMNKYGYIEICPENADRIPKRVIDKALDIYDVNSLEELMYWSWAWESFEGGSHGGLGVWYSPKENKIIVLEGTWWKHSNSYTVKYYVHKL